MNTYFKTMASRPATFLERDSNTGRYLCWSIFLRKLQALEPANLFKAECCKIFKNTILAKICKQLLLQFLLLTVNISFWVVVSAPNSIDLLQRSTSRFKKFFLGCLVVGSSFTWKKKEKLAGMVTGCTTRCHLLPLVVTRCTTRLSFHKRSSQIVVSK